MAYVKTDTYLDKILARKVEEIAEHKAQTPINAMMNRARAACVPRDFREALHKDTVALIAEVKKASPSKGVLMADFNPEALGKLYAENGASAISVLTDVDFFQGHLDYLYQVRGVVGLPVLRKDFIIDPYQVYEARSVDADAVLLIVAALEDGQLAELHQTVLDLGMTPLVEVHDDAELDRALKVGAVVVGVNNRNLKTFDVNLDTTARIAARIPQGVTLVAESGLKSPEDVSRMGSLGAHAVLIGEGLVKSADIAEAVAVMSRQVRVAL